LIIFCLAASWGARAAAEVRIMTNTRRPSEDASGTAGASGPVIRWRNGESLPGELEGATPEEIMWQSPIFSEPLVLRTSAMDLMESPRRGIDSKEPFAVTLRNGDLVHGSLISIGTDTVKLRSECHGELTLRRPEVLSLRRVRGGKLVYASPSAGVEWRIKDDGNTPPRWTKTPWKTGPGGAPVLNSWNRMNELSLKFPDKVEVEFHVRSTASPRFRLSLNASADASPSIETWDDTLVLVHQGQFAALRDLKPEDRDVSLRLFWDHPGRHCAVYSSAGELLAELTEREGSKRGLSESGIYLRNTGLDITLVSLRVREWNGKPPSRVNPGKSRVELFDGTVERGGVSGADDQSVRIKSGAGEEKAVRLQDVESIVLHEGSSPREESWQSELAFADGSFVSGTLIGIHQGTASLKTSWSTQPVAAKIEGLKLLRFAASSSKESNDDAALEKMDRLVVGKTSLHGRPVGSDDGVLRWLTAGGVHPVPLATNTRDIEVMRTLAPDAPGVKPQALFFIEGGDVLPGGLRGMDENFVHFKSDIAEVTKVPASSCYAVQFAGPEVSGAGFSDPGWRRVKGDAKAVLLNGDSLTLSGGGMFGHPTMMQAEELRFSLKTQQGYGVIRVRLFTDDLKAPNRGVPILLMRSGDQLSCGIESENGNGFDDRGQFTVPSGKTVDIRLVVQEKSVEVLVGDVSLQKLPAPPERRAGLGMGFELANIWGNGERPMVVSNFSARLDSERIWFPPVDAEARMQALRVPRFRRDELPTHVLVAANGDLLRGRIAAATAQSIRFHSGLEVLNIPRQRVTAAIRLTPPSAVGPDGKTTEAKKEATQAAPEILSLPVINPTHWLMLRDGGRLALAVEKFEPDRIVGRSENFGQCIVPMDLVHIVRFSQPPLTAAMSAFQSWKLEHMIDPVLPETGGQSSPLLGKEAKDFKLKLLDGSEFELSKEKGKVVILDFWATWCGPCVKSLPELMDAMREFDPERVRLIGVNQAETSPVVKKFLEQRGWNLIVALDSVQSVGRQFGVEGIPHTVIVGPDGKIGWVKTGYDPGGAREAANAVRKMLEGPGKAQ
jgi:peroxiredoxin